MDSLINTIINEVLNPLIFLFFGLAVIIFLSGIIRYVAKADDDAERRKGSKQIAYGIIGFVIMTGAWGILQFFDSTVESIDSDTDTTLDLYCEGANCPS